MTSAADGLASAGLSVIGAARALSLVQDALAAVRASAGLSSGWAVAVQTAMQAVEAAEAFLAACTAYAAYKSAQLGYATAAYIDCILGWTPPGGGSPHRDDNGGNGGAGGEDGEGCEAFPIQDEDGVIIGLDDPNGCMDEM